MTFFTVGESPGQVPEAAPSGSWPITSAAIPAPEDTFIPNMGQVPNGEVLFYTQSGTAAFCSDSVFLYWREGAETSQGPEGSRREALGASGGKAVRISFPGSNAVVPEGCGLAAWESNFFTSRRDRPLTGVPNYASVIYRNLWDGVDLTYRTEAGALKYEFTVRPHFSHSVIKVQAEGLDGMSVGTDGSLEMHLGGNATISDKGLRVFHSDRPDGVLRSSFLLLGGGAYSYSISGRDPGREMIIDPLICSTFLGGGGFDRGTDVAVGDDGCTYVTGYTDSLSFPTVPGSFGTEYFGYSHDVFVSKFSADGSTLLYSTYLGDTAGDYSQAITVDSDGCAYIAGHTMSYDYPTTPGAYQRVHAGEEDAFVTKLSPAGDSIIYSTFLGGNLFDYARGIAVDVNGFAYVLGETISPSFPTTPNAIMRTYHAQPFDEQNGNIPRADLFVTKLSESGESLSYSTFLGHDGAETAGDIAVDGKGYAYVTGSTTSESYPRSLSAFDDTHNGAQDVLLSKISQTGTSLIYSTFLGGPGIDIGLGIAVGSWGQAYVAGYTSSPRFPTTPGAFDTVHNGMMDAFVSMLGKNGESLGYSTFIGGSGNDIANGLALDPAECVYLAGQTDSGNFPVTVGSLGSNPNGGQDAFMCKLSAGGDRLLHSAYLGGAGSDSGTAIEMGADGYAYMTGETASPGYPTTPGAAFGNFSGNTDAFLTKFDITPPVADPGPDRDIREGDTLSLSGAGSSDNHGIVNYTWTFNDGNVNVTYFGISHPHTFPVPGIYSISLNVSDATGNWDADTMRLTVLDITPPTAVAGPDILSDEDLPVTFNGYGSSDNVGIVNYTWSFILGQTAVELFGPAPTYVFAMPGIYDVELETRDAGGNTATDRVIAQIIDITAPTASAGRDASVYRYLDFRFNGTASRDNVQITDYTWAFYDGISDVTLHGVTPSHTFTVPGVYPVSLTVTDTAGLIGTDTMTLSVLEIIKPVAVAGPDIVCDESVPVVFDGSGCTDNVGVAEWRWEFSDGLNDVTVFGESAQWIFTVPGIFNVNLTAFDAAGNSDSDTLTVTVLDRFAPVANPGPNQIIAAGSQAFLDGSGSSDSSGIANHTWDFVYNGTAVTLRGATQSFEFWTPGIYAVTLTVTDNEGRTASSQTVIRVLPPSSEGSALSVEGAVLPVTLIALLALTAAFFAVRRGKGGKAK